MSNDRMLHFLDTDFGFVCLEEILKDLSEEHRTAILDALDAQEKRIQDLQARSPLFPRCLGCGRRDC